MLVVKTLVGVLMGDLLMVHLAGRLVVVVLGVNVRGMWMYEGYLLLRIFSHVNMF